MGRIALMLAAAALPATAIAAEPASGGGMPQLDFSNPLMLAQIVWLLVIFGILYAVMAGPALPGVAEVLAARRARIGGDLDAAQAAKAAADTAMASHQAAMARARAEAQAAVNAAVQAAQADAATRTAALNARLDTEIAAAEQRIGASRDGAMRALPQVAGDTAEALVTRLIGSADRAAIERAVGAQLLARRAA